MSTAWKPVTNLDLKVGWLECSCPCLVQTDAPRTAGLGAGNSCLFFFFFFSNSASPGSSQWVGKQPPSLPPHPHSHHPDGDGAQKKRLGGGKKLEG